MILERPPRRNPLSLGLRRLLPAIMALVALCLWTGSARADFRLCNNTSGRVGIALGYKDAEGWTTEGRWNVCSRDKEFTSKGTEKCLARGFDRTGLFEVDTGEQRAWTVQLTDANEQPAQQRVPGIPGTVGPGGNVPGLPNSPGATPPPGSSGLPPAAAPGPKP